MFATLVSLILTFGGLPQAAAPRGVAVSGVVQDQSGAVLQGAEVALVAAGSPAPVQTVVSDASGLFRFDRVMPSAYDVRSAFPGFTR